MNSDFYEYCFFQNSHFYATASPVDRAFATSAGVDVDYTLKSTNVAETERASAELDRKVQNNDLVLPAAQTAVAELCTTCASLDVDKKTSRTLSVDDEKSSANGMRLTLLNVLLVSEGMFKVS